MCLIRLNIPFKEFNTVDEVNRASEAHFWVWAVNIGVAIEVDYLGLVTNDLHIKHILP